MLGFCSNESKFWRLPLCASKALDLIQNTIPTEVPIVVPDSHSAVVQGAKKKEKNLTSVSFAFTHTYTPVKTNIFPFFPQAYMENFEKCAKTGNMGTLGGGWGC